MKPTRAPILGRKTDDSSGNITARDQRLMLAKGGWARVWILPLSFSGPNAKLRGRISQSSPTLREAGIQHEFE